MLVSELFTATTLKKTDIRNIRKSHPFPHASNTLARPLNKRHKLASTLNIFLKAFHLQPDRKQTIYNEKEIGVKDY